MLLTQTQLIAAIADRADLSNADTKRVLDALDEVALESWETRRRSGSPGWFSFTVRERNPPVL